MRRFVRIALWSLAVVALLAGGTLLWIESELRPEALARRIPGALESAGIKGAIAGAEGSVDGSFKMTGIDLTLSDGTKIKAASLKGDIGVLSSIVGKYALESLEAKGLEIELSGRKTAAESPAAPTSEKTPRSLPSRSDLTPLPAG
jgi:autotransporter translocation and assembly factor TamB